MVGASFVPVGERLRQQASTWTINAETGHVSGFPTNPDLSAAREVECKKFSGAMLVVVQL